MHCIMRILYNVLHGLYVTFHNESAVCVSLILLLSATFNNFDYC